jgi:type IV secretory pathway VirB10-like protein
MNLGTKPNSEAEPLALSSPQFDDERTLLSARPVVPLDQVKQPRLKQTGFLFAGTLLVALLFAASLIYFSDKQPVTQAAPEATSDTTDSSAEKTAALKDVDSDDKSSSSIAEAPEPSRAARSVTPVNKRENKVAHRERTITNATRLQKDEVNDDEEYYLDRQMRREVLRDERRLERQAERAGRARRAERDQVFRIPEIFEGRRKPHLD